MGDIERTGCSEGNTIPEHDGIFLCSGRPSYLVPHPMLRCQPIVVDCSLFRPF